MISTDKVFEILPVVSVIYDKVKIKEFIVDFHDKATKKDVSKFEELEVGLDLFAYILRQSATIKDEVISLVSILDEKDIEEVKKQSFVKSMMSIKDIFQDKELLDFFKQAMQ